MTCRKEILDHYAPSQRRMQCPCCKGLGEVQCQSAGPVKAVGPQDDSEQRPLRLPMDVGLICGALAGVAFWFATTRGIVWLWNLIDAGN